jgi:hypothetical protein
LTAPKGVKCGPALHLLIRPLNSSHIARRKKHGASGFIWGFFIDPTEKNSNSLLRQGYEGRESTRRSRRVKVGASRKRGFREWPCAEQILKMLISNPPAPPYAASTPHGAFAGSACFCSKLFKCLKAIRNPLTKPEGPKTSPPAWSTRLEARSHREDLPNLKRMWR